MTSPIENGNKKRNRYELLFTKRIATQIEKFIKIFHISIDILINKLLLHHLEDFLHELESRDYELLCFYYFSLGQIFFEQNRDKIPLHEPEHDKKKIIVNVREDTHEVITDICEEIHYDVKKFVKKAIKHQWESIESAISADNYVFIENYCNVAKIKQSLKKIVNTNSKHPILFRKRRSD